MNGFSFFVITLYFSVITHSYAAARLADGTIITIETIEPKRLNLNTFTGGGNIQGGRRQYQTLVNGQPVTIEVIREEQLNRYGQMEQNQNYWQHMQKQNYYPIKPHQGSVIVTKEKSPNPNIEVYDVYTNYETSNNRYPLSPDQFLNKFAVLPSPIRNTNNNRHPSKQPMYPSGNWFPNPNSNRYPNHNFNSYPNPNIQNHNTDGMNHHTQQDGQKTTNLNELNTNKNEQNNHLSNKSDKNTDQSNKDNNKYNVAGYIDKFPVILLNENEIRR